YRDPDSDGDGIGDLAESGMTGNDTDGDGLDDALDASHTGGPDTNGDGIDDGYVVPDTDGDGVPDLRDLDSDNDGLNDVLEAPLVDVNDDGFLDAGVEITTEPLDTDGDGVPDYLDLDSDGDGVPDIESSHYAHLDTDGDGAIDAGPDTDGDGIPDSRDDDPNGFGNWRDTDGDGIPDSIDADIDGDGIPNELDGIDEDTDGDGIPNAWDLDSDNDGIADLVEAGGADSDGDGKFDEATDTDGNGLADSLEAQLGGVPLNVRDTDGDGQPDHADTDSDGDGITDLVEIGGTDTDGDGQVDDFVDEDGNGLHDGADGSRSGGQPAVIKDSDGDGVPDFQDTDADGDGFVDADEGTGDANNNGVPDYLEAPAQVETAVSGAGSMNLIALIFLAFAAVAVRSRRARAPLAATATAGLLAVAILAAPPTMAQESDDGQPASPWSVGVDIGISDLDPRTQGDFRVADGSAYGIRLSGGYRWSEKWNFEASYVDAGEVRIASTIPAIGEVGGIEYRMLSAGARYAFLDGGDTRSLYPYLQAGVARIRNSATNSLVPFSRVNSQSVYIGAGGAWRMASGWRLHAEIVSYDRDARFLSFGVRRGF
ncbi:MAG: outer membrane beta-barrel protein, partial [Woeseia sp.]